MLYALQIASSNLKRMEAEKPRPAQVVVDTEKVAETPLGMTPWSKKEGGHEIEDIAPGLQGELAIRLKSEVMWARERYQMARNNERDLAKELNVRLDGAEALTLERARHVMAVIASRLEEG